ncbi:hypothetical protein OAJ79_04615 [Verrucomicrobia bacterium]|nr:hypothetical protein [Verrucomicrobiota bacterium]
MRTLTLLFISAAAAMAADISGIIKLDGPQPKRPPLPLTPESRKLYEGKPYPRDEVELVNEKREIQNVFVYIRKGLPTGKTYPAPKKPALLDQQRSMFRPRVQGLFVGQDFAMRNSDPIIHNVRSLSQENRPFNIAQPAGTPDRLKRFSNKEGPIELRCDFHRWMRAYIFVMEHPFFAITDAKGRFQIKNLPPGEYTLATWHESFGKNKQIINVGVDGLNNVTFAYKPKQELNFE